MTTMTTKTPTPLRKPSLFLPADGALKVREIVALSGETKSGKSHFALATSPQPVFYICFDTNGIEVAKKIKRETGRDIRIAQFRIQARNLGAAEYKAEWQHFTEAWYEAVEADQGTLVVDTWTEAYECCRLAEFGKLESVRSRYYGALNADLKLKMRDLHNSNLNAVLIAKMRDEYVDDNRTGKRQPAVWGDTPFQVDSNIEMYRDDAALAGWRRGSGPRVEEDGTLVWPFHFFVTDCRNNMTLCGQDFTTNPVGFGEWLDLVFNG